MAENVVRMAIKVDLGCYRCYKKIKKVICKFPEIRDQMYDEKANMVLIKVVSCCPDRIRDKIASKGGKTVERIEILPEKKPEKKDGDKAKEKDKKKKEKSEGGGGGKGKPGEGGGGKPSGGQAPPVGEHKYITQPVSGYPTIYPSGIYYHPPQPYYQGYGAVPYHHRVPAYYTESSYDVNRGYNTNHTDYLREENPESCIVM